MSIFKRKSIKEGYSNFTEIIEKDLSDIKMNQESLERRVYELDTRIPALVRESVIQLARSENIVAVTTYRDKEFFTKVVADEVKALRHKKAELERAISECDNAIAKIKEENETQK